MKQIIVTLHKVHRYVLILFEFEFELEVELVGPLHTIRVRLFYASTSAIQTSETKA